MRKYLFIIFILFLTLGSIIFGSCKKSPVTPQTTEQKIIGKWTIKSAIGNYTTLGTNHKDTTNYTTADYFNFKADGTLTIVETGATYNGKWKITNNKLFISQTNYIDYTSGFDIPVITSSKLQLYYTETTSVSTLEQKLDLSR